MKHLEFAIEIAASKQKVWETMLQPETYKKWVDASWPGSYYVGEWKQGKEIKFLSSSGEGTQATLDEVRPYELIKATHNAVITKAGKEDRDSDIAKGWVGTKESYVFTERNGKTEVKVQISTSPDWEKMFSDGWPDALAKLKEVVESK